MRSTFLSLLMPLLILPASLFQEDTDVLQNKEVVIQFEKNLKNRAHEIANIYPSVKAELEKTLKRKINFRPTVTLVKDRKMFQKIVNSISVVAVAIPSNNMIIIDNSRMNEHPFTLEITLKHELCHLMLHNYIEQENLPKWLNEGISQWTSGGIAEIVIGEKRDVLKQAVLNEKLIGLMDLSEHFPEDEMSFLLSYEESKSIVEYIIREFGTSGLLNVLSFLEKGADIDTAISEGISISYSELEKNWHENLRSKITWATYISTHVYTIVFFLAALITVYGFIRLLIRKWTYKDEDEQPPQGL